MITKKRDLRTLVADMDDSPNLPYNQYQKYNQNYRMEHQKKRQRQDAPIPQQRQTKKPDLQTKKPSRLLYQTISDDWAKPNRPDDLEEPPKKKQKKQQKQPTVFMEIDDSENEDLADSFEDKEENQSIDDKSFDYYDQN